MPELWKLYPGLPHLLGKESALELAAETPDVEKNALRLKKIGNELLKAIGERSVHPVNVCVGGFYSWPNEKAIKDLLPDLEWGLNVALDTVKLALTMDYPFLEIDYEFVALHHPDEYGVIEGDVLSSNGRKLSIAEYENGYIEEHVIHSRYTVTPWIATPISSVHWHA